MALVPLHFRAPERTWMILSVVAALCLHGVQWYLSSLLMGSDDALGETQRQTVLAAFWIIFAIVLWKISPPPSRLHALLLALCGALFITLAGNAAALLNYMVKGVTLTRELVSAFALYRGVKGLGELVVAIPTAVLLQGLALSRKGT